MIKKILILLQEYAVCVSSHIVAMATFLHFVGLFKLLGQRRAIKGLIVMMICLNSDLSSDQKNNIEKSRMCDNL